ncbi:MAG: phosphoenolpyruvate carboxykinase (ATP) [Deltaproteobacteria bacterium]|nr:MAG: phosphoenolpyruvate carboxykinase (ATP) [Deltaproteobacteria bacterium]
MSTRSRINPNNARAEISAMRAAAVTLSCGPRVKHNPSMNVLYDMASEQSTTIVTDVPMADPKSLGLSGGRDRVIVSYTGKDAARSAWARLVAPQPDELRRNPSLLDTKDRIERLTRDINFELLHQDLIHTEVYYGRNKDYMGKIHLIVPAKYSKLAYDLNLNFYRSTPELEELYSQSTELPLPDLWLVCYPDWVNPVWQAWRNRINPADSKRVLKDPEPKRLMMLFDIPFNTAYLLGARYFGEVKKACLTMIWDAAVNAGIGMPIHGSAKTIYVNKSTIQGAEEQAKGKSKTKAKSKTKSKAKKSASKSNGKSNGQEDLKSTTFITIGLSGSGKSTIGNDPHEDYLSEDKGEGIHIGNDDALVVLYNPSDPNAGTVGLENGCYNKSNDYTPGSFYIKTVQSAENIMVARDQDYRLFLIHQDIFSGNGRVQTARHMLPGADDNINVPWPDYISLLMKDETMPPLMRIRDPQLMVSMFMSLATKSTTAENIPVEEMNKLKMVPGANPFNTWGLQQEAEALERTFQLVGCCGLVMNTGGFFINPKLNAKDQTRDIPKELSLGIYPRLARNQIEWEPWTQFPGTEIPTASSLADVYPEYEEHFSPYRVADQNYYYELFRTRMLQRQNFLLKLRIDRRFILPIRRAIIEIDDMELKTRGLESHVDNIDTFLDTGRDQSSLH